ncbi:MAG: aspartate/glutamate racemase family protein [Alphaproteobacteria bacterium]|nr:aspartate/glutamate racemase family protein [Alphaproteobacteria bacterium]
MEKRIAVIGGGLGRTAPLAPIDEVRSPGFTATLVTPRLKVFPHTPYERGLSVIANLDAAIEAQKAGFDAIFINTVGDYGIDEMKSALTIPIVGAGEATMAVAATVGRKFSVVKIWPPRMNFITEERLRNSGAAARCVSVRNVLGDDEVVSTSGAVATMGTMQAGDQEIIERTLEQVRLAVTEDGADTIVLGCTCMASIAPTIAARSSVTVLEPMRTGYTVVEMLLRLGIIQSRVAYPQTNPQQLGALDDMISRMAHPNLSTDCDMCLVSEAAE